MLFLRSRRIEPQEDRFLRFVGLMTQEFVPDQPQDFVFCIKESVKNPVEAALAANMGMFRELSPSMDDSQLSAVVRFIVSGETMTVLDRHPGDVVKIFKAS